MESVRLVGNKLVTVNPYIPRPVRYKVLPVNSVSPPQPEAWVARRFVPPIASQHPAELFGVRAYPGTPIRYVRWTNLNEYLVYTDGACSRNGQSDATAGCGIVVAPATVAAPVQAYSFRLERRGPTGVVKERTSNRAELRAVIGALMFRDWAGEGCTRLVIATDSTYVASGAVDWVSNWRRGGWRTSSEERVKNRDLWTLLVGMVECLGKKKGLQVCFRRIPREWNGEADQAAKGATRGATVEEFCVTRDFSG